MNTKTDAELGLKVRDLLDKKGIETPMIANKVFSGADKRAIIERSFREIMVAMDLDLADDSLRDSPKRVAKMFADELFYGLDYNNFPKNTVISNKMKVNEMVCVKDVLVRSCCEHHFVPFTGVAHVAYIPKKRIIGLSKINRVVDFFCRRPQVQERLTEQISAALAFLLETKDVAVVIEAEHLCVKIRGIQDPSSTTITSKLIGRFRSVPELRAEFLSLTK